MKLTSQASLQIQKPIDEVFEGIINPDSMCKYFISESNGRMETGRELLWKFPEFDEKFPITEIVIEENKSISFVWDHQTIVDIVLKSYIGQSTIVKVSEGGKELNEENMRWLISNTAGWSNFLACMKAYLEYGIGLRKGAYEFMTSNL